ncbi:TPA: T-cell activation Rho GTPase-activating protein-like, partial [Bos taurus]
LDVIDQGNEEDTTTATQRQLVQLPRANVIFPQYHFGLFYNIEQPSSSNQMTAYNLSVCITPSMLCLSNSGSSENFTKQISFIQFLIENCLKIFGEDITCLFGETSVSSDNSDITDITDNSEKVAGSIFSASLYDKWLDVIDQGNDEDKIKATQRLLDQLPRANVVFLRYLFAVLRNIEQHSSSNQMTAYNLSVYSRGHENTGKATRKADETGMSSEKEERRIEPDFEGREYRKQD